MSFHLNILCRKFVAVYFPRVFITVQSRHMLLNSVRPSVRLSVCHARDMRQSY